MTESQDRKRAHPVDSEDEGDDRDESVLEGVFVRRKAKSKDWHGYVINEMPGPVGAAYKSISAYHLGRIRKHALARELVLIPPVEAYTLKLEDDDTAAYLDGMFDQDWLDGYLDDIVHKFSEESKYAVWHSSGGSSQLLAYQMGAPGTGVNLSMPHRTAVAGSDQHILERYYNIVDTGNDMKKATMYNTEHDVERIMDMFLAAKPHPTGLVIFRGVGGGLAKSILDSRKYRQGCTSMMVFHDTFISFSTQARVAARYARLEGVVFVIRAPACGVSILPFLGLAEGGAQRQYEGLLPPQTIFEVHTETLRAPPPSDRGLPHTVECTAYTPLCDGYRAAYDRYIGQRLVYSNEHGLAVCMPYPGQVVGGSLFDGMIKELGDLLGFEDLALDE